MIIAALALLMGQATTTDCSPDNPFNPSAGYSCETKRASSFGSESATSIVRNHSVEECSNATKWDTFKDGGCTLPEIRAAKKIVADRTVVGALISENKCPEARDYALRQGDLDLAERTARICAITAQHQ